MIVRPPVYEQYRRIIRGSPALLIMGELQHGGACIDMLARHFAPLDLGVLTEGLSSRNFH